MAIVMLSRSCLLLACFFLLGSAQATKPNALPQKTDHGTEPGKSWCDKAQTAVISGCDAFGIGSVLCDELKKATKGCLEKQSVGEAFTGTLREALGVRKETDPLELRMVNASTSESGEWEQHASKEARGIIQYTGTEHGCSSAHGQCFWRSVSTAKKECAAWKECAALYCTSKYNGGREPRYAQY